MIKNLQRGDELELIIWDNKEIFARAIILKVWEKPLKDVSDNEFDGHEKFAGKKEMYEIYESYYKRPVDGETIAKFIKFKLL